LNGPVPPVKSKVLVSELVAVLNIETDWSRLPAQIYAHTHTQCLTSVSDCSIHDSQSVCQSINVSKKLGPVLFFE